MAAAIIAFGVIALTLALGLYTATFGQTVVFFRIDTDLLKMLSALLVALFLGIPYLKKRFAGRRRKEAGGT